LNPEQEIFNKMLHGDEKALKVLLTQYHNYLLVVGTRFLTDRLRVEDVIHDVFADLWNKKEDIKIQAGVKSFLRGAVINKCLAIIRKDNRMDFVEEHSFDSADKAPSADKVLHSENLKNTINEIIASLPDKCREVFLLSRNEGKSHKEISEAMGISKKTIENHMTRALKTLKNELKRRELMIIIFILINISFLLGVNT
jgi:RNA polymerase sigma-70 factor (ECF subfamily)